MRVAAILAVLVVASAGFAGCTNKLVLSGASFDEPAFDLVPESGDASTVFKVDASALGADDVAWDFGDGHLAKGPKAEHKYGFTNGVMTITMIATKTDGSQAIATRDVKLGKGVNGKPTVFASAAKSWIEVGRSVNLTARGNDPDRDALSFLWTYRIVSGGAASDGHGHAHGASAPAATAQEFVIAGSGDKTNVSFDAPGKYAVKVRVKDPKGAEAAAEFSIDVSRKIPDSVQESKFTGVLVAGTGGHASASEALWATPAPDTFVDAGRHAYELKYPASTFIVLTWNDSTQQGVFDLDLELRHAENGTVVFSSATRAPAAPYEFNFTQQEPGKFLVVVRNVAGAQVAYDLVVRSTLYLTPDRVAAVEG